MSEALTRFLNLAPLAAVIFTHLLVIGQDPKKRESFQRSLTDRPQAFPKPGVI
jgi:hypothetical protein